MLDVNDQPGALLLDHEGGLISVMALDIVEGEIGAIRSVVNPDKLAHLGRRLASAQPPPPTSML